ncbi:nitrite reductase (NADH) large subunit [Geomicrobium halophilum]|uniref:Nitrite reductase (NADH) large subunit n=1 Tax=Geomicrobium halophilum TaxID=549000 RepID=A0A841PMN0_9BACL|nr:nitrite reductase large subunit NirB [Geomicrobium halophilum]MBB6450107.1 nitrite reductase (NADH) large subunit [Geomicrobium halophilum]
MAQQKQRLVLIGNGMAGLRSVEEVLSHSSDQFEITIFGSEPHPSYNRLQLSSVLQGNQSFADIEINQPDWYQEHQINLRTEETVTQIDTNTKTVQTDQHGELSYDKLVIATGSNPIFIPFPGADKEGVMAFRTINDCKQMIEAAKHYKKAVVIGGGLLGLEAARGLLNLGMEVDVVHLADRLMERQLDQDAAVLLQEELTAQGMNFFLGKDTSELVGGERVEGVCFKDGTQLTADLVIMAVGVKPNIELAKNSGVTVNKGIVVDDQMRTNIPDVYAVGECAEHRDTVYALVKPLYEQAKVLAKAVCGIGGSVYRGTTLSTQLKVSGVDVFSAGSFMSGGGQKALTVFDELNGHYKKLVFDGDQLSGAILFGDTREGMRLLQLVIEQKELTNEEKQELLQGSSSNHGVAEMSQAEMVCNCNAVSKGTIIEAAQSNCLTTVDQIKENTKASSSCGSCKPVVSELLTYMESDNFNEKIEVTSMCECTELTEEEVVEELQIRGLSSIHEVMSALDWSSNNGCKTCRPALSYYLGMIHSEYHLTHHLKKNAEQQEDGTYIVTPPYHGGVISVDQLQRLSSLTQRLHVGYVVMTSDQRLQLQGIKEEHLSTIWAHLDMSKHSLEGYHVQPVVTSHSSNCRCDLYEIQSLATRLDQQFERLQVPSSVNIQVKCNHAERLFNDLSVFWTRVGQEIYIDTSLFYVAEHTEETFEIVSALLQYYRQTARFLQSMEEWITKVGVVHVREIVLDTEFREQLLEQLQEDAFLNKKAIAIEETIM